MVKLNFLEIFLNVIRCKMINCQHSIQTNPAEDKLMIVFLFFPENRLLHFMQIVSLGDNLHEMSKPIF